MLASVMPPVMVFARACAIVVSGVIWIPVVVEPAATAGRHAVSTSPDIIGIDEFVASSMYVPPVIWSTTEPSDSVTNVPLRAYNVHPQTGIEVRFNADDEILVGGTSGGRLGLRIKADAPVNCLAHLSFEE